MYVYVTLLHLTYGHCLGHDNLFMLHQSHSKPQTQTEMFAQKEDDQKCDFRNPLSVCLQHWQSQLLLISTQTWWKNPLLNPFILYVNINQSYLASCQGTILSTHGTVVRNMMRCHVLTEGSQGFCVNRWIGSIKQKKLDTHRKKASSMRWRLIFYLQGQSRRVVRGGPAPRNI